MDFGRRLRIGTAAGVALAAAGAIALAGNVEAGPAVFTPDLKTVSPGPGTTLDLKETPKRVVLRISNKIANEGTGPLELYATDATSSGGPGGNTDCTVGDYPEPVGADRDANQVIYEDDSSAPNGFYDPDDDPAYEEKVGCFEYHAAHGHWHFQDFSQYRLEGVASGELVPPTQPSRKIGFCILDGDRVAPGLPGSPEHGVYPQNTDEGQGCGQGDPETAPGAMGLSVGYADIYTYSLPGQKLDVTGVARGDYCLVSIANPPEGASEIIESDPANNERRREVRINPAKDKARFTGEDCPDPTP